jgi:putative component of membrane protein insertase Oxa1/YidC/SpoIIIJ protein YidD
MPEVSCCGCGCGTVLPAVLALAVVTARTRTGAGVAVVAIGVAATGNVDGLANRAALGAIRAYQRHAPTLARCRFEPSCSAYALACFERDPFRVAAAKTALRLASCNPWTQATQRNAELTSRQCVAAHAHAE